MDFIVLEKHSQRVNICWARLCKIQRRYFRSCAKDIWRWYSLDQPTLLHTFSWIMCLTRETESWNRRNELGPGFRAGRDRAKEGEVSLCPPSFIQTSGWKSHVTKGWCAQNCFSSHIRSVYKNLSAHLLNLSASVLNNHSCNTNADTSTFKYNLPVKCSSPEPRSTPTKSHPQQLQQPKWLLEIKKIWNKNW